MPKVEVVLSGLSIASDQLRPGLGSAVLIQGRGNTLVDVGHYGRRQILEEGLKRCGLTPADINTVVITHAHWDHCQNVDFFPNAQFIIHAKEVEYSRSPRSGDFATPRYFASTLQGLNVREITGDLELEPGVRVIETPGHTIGHLSVVVDTPEGRVVIAGDALGDAGCIERGTPIMVFWDEELAARSVKRITEEAKVIYPGHDRPFRLKEDGSTEYIGGGTPSIQFSGALEKGGSTVAVTLSLYPPRVPLVLPEAKRR